MVKAEIDEVALKTRAAAGESSTQIAEALGHNRQVIMRRARKIGVEVPGNRKRSIRSIESEIAQMKPADAVEHLLNILRESHSSMSHDVISEVAMHGFTGSESSILLSLFSDKLMSKEMIYDLLYGMRATDEIPEPKIIDALVCKIRKKLKVKGWDVKIETVWGRGYRGERLNGFLFPWEVN